MSKEILKKFPAPKGFDQVGVDMWNLYLPELAKRKNFNPIFLSQLKILCKLHSDLERLETFLFENGQTYKVEARNGEYQIKPRPEVRMKVTTQTDIIKYCTLLKLIIDKPDVTIEDQEKADWE